VIRRVLITGSRNWAHQATIRVALAELWHPDTVLVSGACPTGADALCEACWAHWQGRIERHPAQWRHNGVFVRSAGFRRNETMVAAGADVCLAFIRDESPGATHTAHRARQAGIHTIIYRATTGLPGIARYDIAPIVLPEGKPAPLSAALTDESSAAGS
jgi:hypothetical protein